MKRLTLILVCVAVILGVASINLTAQAPDTRIVFVNSQAAIAAHPAGDEAIALEAQAREELSGIQSSIQELAERARAGEQLTAEDQERYQTLLATLQTVQQRYEAEIATAAEPAVTDVDQTIRALAQENGYSIVLDAVEAGPRGTNLVVYAQEGLDITELVIERIQATP
ncbi:MAG: OmpH family outer membrane protein [Trueperaceae bacterium]